MNPPRRIREKERGCHRQTHHPRVHRAYQPQPATTEGVWMLTAAAAADEFMLRMFVQYLIVVFTILTLAGPAAAQTNWPSFRGANADGIAKAAVTPTVWNVEKSENVRWKKAIPGLGHSSPIIWEDRLFITTAVNQRKAAPLKVGLYGDPGSAE